jgi:hypothetical protein
MLLRGGFRDPHPSVSDVAALLVSGVFVVSWLCLS